MSAETLLEIQTQDSKEQFKKHLEHSSEIVQSWPVWKQEVLGGTAVQPSEKTTNEQELAEKYIQGYRIGYSEAGDIAGNITTSVALQTAHYAWRSGYMDGWKNGLQEKRNRRKAKVSK